MAEAGNARLGGSLTCAGKILRFRDVLQRAYGVCRDFAHLAIALNRTFNIPARYVTGRLPDIGFPDPENHMNFRACAEVYLGGQWFTTDARFHYAPDRSHQSLVRP